MKWSDCHVEAWANLRSGDAEYICLRFTTFSRLHPFTQTWWWTPMRVLGMLIQWCLWPLLHVGELIRTGRWYHATWITWDDQHCEFVPVKCKRSRWLPPLLFFGHVRDVRHK